MASASLGLELPATSLIAPFLAAMARSWGSISVRSIDGVYQGAPSPCNMRGFIVPQVFPPMSGGQLSERLSVYCSRVAGAAAADRVPVVTAADRRLAGVAGLGASAGGSVRTVACGSEPAGVRKMPAAS